MNDAAALLREHLRQRRELGETELVLDGITAAALLRLVDRRRSVSLPEAVQVSPAHALRTAPSSEPQPASRRERARTIETAPALTPRERAAGAPAPGPSASEIVQLGDLAHLRATALGCPRCRLSETRTQVVFGEGDEHARLMVVGEAPGADEDRTGRPFVGKAGKLLNLLLASVGFERESVYICNVLKCRPPANRNPEPAEIEACTPYLRRQLELVEPQVILAVGMFASQTLLGSKESINQLRGRVHRYEGVPLVSTYHPAALLRNPSWIRPVWEDLQRLRSLLDDDSARV